MKKVLIRGPLLTNSGYGYHSRQVFQWLYERSDVEVTCLVTPWGLTSWIIDSSFDDNIVQKIMSTTKNQQEIQGEVFDISFQIQLPNEWENIAAKNVGITAAVETNLCNPEWSDYCNRMDAVVVPSNFSKKNLESSSKNITTDIFVIPEFYHSQFDKENISGEDKLSCLLDNIESNFNFLLAGQITGNNSFNDRKNIFNTIKLFCEEFANDKNVGLVLKLNSGQNTTIDKKVTESVVERTIEEIGKDEFPKIYLVHGDLNFKELKTLYKHNKIKCLISLTRGEGYGLHLQEAAVNSLPVIATNWSGHLDFLNLGKFLPVKYTLEDIHQTRVDNNIFIQGSKWASPDEEDAKKRMRKFYNEPEKPLDWSKNLSEKIKLKLNKNSVIKIYNDKLDYLFG